MYRLMIVDDEPFIVDGLTERFEKLEYDNLEVLKAYSYLEALNWLHRAKIDIVISDIHMPGMSGLELQKLIVRQWPRCKVIFLTGYDDFSYIQEAVRNGSVDYLLKTEDMERIAAAVHKAMADIKREQDFESLIDKANKQIALALPTFQKEFLWSILQGDPASIRQIEHQFRNLQIPLHPDESVGFMLARVDEWRENYSARDRMLMFYAIQNIAEELLSPFVSAISIVFEHNKLVWLLQPKRGIEDNAEEVWQRAFLYIRGTLENIQKTCGELLHLRVSFIASNENCGWEKVEYHFEQLRKLFNFGLGMGDEVLLLTSPSAETMDPGSDASRPIHSKRLYVLGSYLESGESDKFFDSFEQYVGSPEAIKKCGEYNVRLEIYYTLASIFLSYMNRGEWAADTMPKEFNLNKIISIHEHSSWEEAVRYFRHLAELIFDSKRSGMHTRQDKLIEQIDQYIASHVSEDLSLTCLGEAFAFNPSYLSRIYKQRTGKGLSETIVELRIAKAKQLLQSSSYRIHEIAEQVGYETANNFYRYFRNVVGMTPQEYRDLYGNK